MKKLAALFSVSFLLICSLCPKSRAATTPDDGEKYSINADGDAFFFKELSTSLSFPDVCSKVTEVISSNFVNAGAGVSLNNQENLFMANYIFPAVQKDFPLVLDAWCILKVELKNEQMQISLTLTNYSKHTGHTQAYIRISDTQPLNPRGEKYGFRSQKKLTDAFENTIEKALALFDKLQRAVENKL